MTKISQIRCAVIGAGGRMGKVLIEAIKTDENFRLTAATMPKNSVQIGQKIDADNNVSISDCLYSAVVSADVILDFTNPQTSLLTAEACAQGQKKHIIGTTGFTKEQEEKLQLAAQYALIVKSGNMSLGLNLIMALTEQMAQRLGDDFDIEILEMHHNRKKDAPSGAALMLGKAAAKGRGLRLEGNSEWTRYGTSAQRHKGKIGFAVLRGGDVVGEHRVFFISRSERIEIAHVSQNRAMFAEGALHAAKWAFGQKKTGIYQMADVLGIKT